LKFQLFSFETFKWEGLTKDELGLNALLINGLLKLLEIELKLEFDKFVPVIFGQFTCPALKFQPLFSDELH
jgi:hypothetical protein